MEGLQKRIADAAPNVDSPLNLGSCPAAPTLPATEVGGRDGWRQPDSFFSS